MVSVSIVALRSEIKKAETKTLKALLLKLAKIQGILIAELRKRENHDLVLTVFIIARIALYTRSSCPESIDIMSDGISSFFSESEFINRTYELTPNPFAIDSKVSIDGFALPERIREMVASVSPEDLASQ